VQWIPVVQWRLSFLVYKVSIVLVILCFSFSLVTDDLMMNDRTDSELKTYNCTKPSSNGNYCKQWDSLENSLDEFEIGKTTCLVESANGNYCQEWESTASEYKKCWIEYYPPTSDDNGIRPFCCDSSSSQALSCCQSLCPVGFYNNPQTQYEKSTCSCQAESKNGLYCSVWYCAEQTVFSLSAIHSDQPIEHEWYTCSDVNEATSLNSYCSAWDGDIDSREEFEVATCACQTSSANNAYCVNWFCFEKGYDYWWPNLLWALLSSILGGLPLFVIALESKWFCSVYFWVPYFVWSGGFIVIGVWMAGFGVALISAAVLYMFPWMIWLAVHGVSRATIPGYNAVNRPRRNRHNYEVEASHVELEMATAVAIAEVEEK
jgi:hypothetical protein